MASATARVAAQIQSQLSPPSMASVGLASLETDERMAGHHRFAAVRAHCHELAGDRAAAAAGYAGAARTATSLPERRYLEARAANWRQPGPVTPAPQSGPVRHVPQARAPRQAPRAKAPRQTPQAGGPEAGAGAGAREAGAAGSA